MDQLIVKDAIDINASAARVWSVLTDPESTRQYMFGCRAVTDWKVGSPLEWTATVEGKDVVYVKGAILAAEPRRLFSYTVFGTNMGLADVPSNYLTVTCRLMESEGKTRLEISQGDFAGAADGEKRYQHTVAGWRETLPKIKALAERE